MTAAPDVAQRAVAAPPAAGPLPPPEPPAPRARRRVAPVVAWVVALVSGGATVAAIVLDAVTSTAAREAAHASAGWIIGAPGLFLAVPAWLLLARLPRHPASWVVAGNALVWGLDGLAQSWLTRAVQGDEPLPGATPAFWVVSRFGAWLLIGLPLLLLVYPDGRLPGGWWRIAAVVSLASTAVLPLLLMVAPSAALDAAGDTSTPAIYDGVDLDPTSLPLPSGLVEAVARVALPVATLGVLLPVAAVVARYRAARGTRREQMRWLLWAAVVDALVMLATLLLPGDVTSLALGVAVGLTGAAVTVGLLRPRLVDIDQLLGGTLVYGGLAVAVVLLDLAVLAVAGALLGDRLGDRDATLLALLVVTALYVPLRAQAWQLVRRWVLGGREDPYRVVAGLAEQLERSEGVEDQLRAVTRAVAEAFRSAYVGVEIEAGPGRRLVVETGRRPAGVQGLSIAYRGEEVGRLLLPRDGVRASLVARDERLLADVVRQAAAAAQASALAGELQASREQLVAAREEERRRLRRDLHDGLGPSLGAVVLRIDTARNLARSRPDDADSVLRQARDEVAGALADVRRLVHDLRPPALDDLGLAGAVRQQAERLLPADVMTSVTAGPGTDGLPAAVEVAAYRIASEALANVARHAAAMAVRVSLLRDAAGRLVVTVVDDGVGIAPGAPAGVGLVSLRERAAELGGRCSVTCPPEGGTVVRAVLPVEEERPA
ncbi:sensor histidine kinase [Trujillonella endophytica]|uniref:sensor histidine kinase n=1 Tax=Trujillonella endophytica TaxID=673521 RepID=UPI0011134DA5|nr:histidine kinase [Trujillella endophytica]